jgi:hypothetical protein
MRDTVREPPTTGGGEGARAAPGASLSVRLTLPLAAEEPSQKKV